MTNQPTTRSAQCAHCGNHHGLLTNGTLQPHVTAAQDDWCPGSFEIPVPDPQTLGILAWDLSDAFAKTIDDHHLDFGLDEIQSALPQIIAAIQSAGIRSRAKGAGS